MSQIKCRGRPDFPKIILSREDEAMFEIKEVSNVEATASTFGMWAGGAIGVGACVAGAKLLLLVLAC